MGSSEDEPDVEADEQAHEARLQLADVERIAGVISEQDPEWRLGEPLSFGELGWRADLIRDAQPERRPAVLHIHLAERLRPYVMERMHGASTEGYDVHMALPLASLYDEDLIVAVNDLDPQIHLIRDPAGVLAEPSGLLSVLCDERVRVTPATRTALATMSLEMSKAGATAQIRGRRYEGLISFLLSQVADFDVVERNLRTDTEELDVVVQLRATHGRVWTGLGAPLILVEAKNWKDAVPQKEASAFRVKMEGRRGAVRLGLMFGASGFTSDALDQELRFASHDLTIAFVSPDELDGWIRAGDGGDEFIETLVRRAMLR